MAQLTSENGKKRGKLIKNYMEGGGSRPSHRLLRVLPLRRWISQDIHSVLDYLSAAAVAGSAVRASTKRGRRVSVALGIHGTMRSLLADYRLSVAKVLPIEVHEAMDLVGGILLMAAPFALNYARKDPEIAVTHVVSGAVLILTSLITDYQAKKGVGRRMVEA